MLSGQDISSIAILTPYNGQVRELQSMQKMLSNIATSAVSIDISSVDAYQASVVPHSWCCMSFMQARMYSKPCIVRLVVAQRLFLIMSQQIGSRLNLP